MILSLNNVAENDVLCYPSSHLPLVSQAWHMGEETWGDKASFCPHSNNSQNEALKTFLMTINMQQEEKQ